MDVISPSNALRSLRGLLDNTSDSPPPTGQETTVRITEIDGEDEPQADAFTRTRWKLAVQCDNGQRNQNVFLSDDYDQAGEDRLRWYLEDHVFEPFEKTKAQSIADELKHYGTSLVEHLGLQSILNHAGPEAGASSIKTTTLYLDIEARRNRPSTHSLHNIHWEILQDPEVWPFHRPDRVIVRRKMLDVEQIGEPTAEVGPTGFNILLVVARSLAKGKNEIGHRQLSLETVKAIRKLPSSTPVHLEIVRPGSFAAFKKHLQSRPKGFFKMVQLDMHGREKEPSLRFVADVSYRKTTYRSTSEVLQLLVEHQIQAVILNACRSATNPKTGDEESVALQLLKGGVQVVIGMSYSLLVDAAGIFVQEFYRSLLVSKTSFAIATFNGREKMRQSRLRNTEYGSPIPIGDYIVPVVYMSKEPALGHWSQPTQRKSSLFANYGNEPNELYGRELDGLKIETRLLRESNMLCLRARPGVGIVKVRNSSRLNIPLISGFAGTTTFLTHLAWWWEVTSFVKSNSHYHLSQGRWQSLSFNKLVIDLYTRLLRWRILEPKKLMEIVDVAEPRKPENALIYKELVQHLRENRQLLIIEALDEWKPRPPFKVESEARTTYRIANRDIMNSFLQDLDGGQTFVIVICRMSDAKLPLNTYTLDGLDREAMRKLADIDISPTAPGMSKKPDPEFFELCDKALDHFDGVPKALSDDLQTLTIDRNQRHPREICQSLHENLCKPRNRNTFDATARRLLCEIYGSDITVGSRPSWTYIVLILAPFWARLPRDLDHYLCFLSLYGGIDPSLTLLGHEKFDMFHPESAESMSAAAKFNIEVVASHLPAARLRKAYDELLSRLQDMDLLTLDEDAPDKYFKINPILTLTLRGILFGKDPPFMGPAISCAFLDYYNLRWKIWASKGVENLDSSTFVCERMNFYSVMYSAVLVPTWQSLTQNFPQAPFLILLGSSASPTRAGSDAPILARISILVLEHFDLLCAQIPYVDVNEVAEAYFLAFYASNYLCLYYFQRGPPSKFREQVLKSDTLSGLGKDVKDTNNRKVSLNLTAAKMKAEAMQSGILDRYATGSMNRSFGTQAELNRKTNEFIQSDQRFLAATPEGEKARTSQSYLPAQLHVLEQAYKEAETHGSPAELSNIKDSIRTCLASIRQQSTLSPTHPISPDIDQWLLTIAARYHLLPPDTATEQQIAADDLNDALSPSTLIEAALATRNAGHVPRAEQMLLRAIKHADRVGDADSAFVCHATLRQIALLRGHWDSAIGHGEEMRRYMLVLGHATGEAGRAFQEAQIVANIGVCLFKLRRWKEAAVKASEALLLMRQCVAGPEVGTREAKDVCYNTLVLFLHLYEEYPPGIEGEGEGYATSVPTTREDNAKERYTVCRISVISEEDKAVEAQMVPVVWRVMMDAELQMGIQDQLYMADVPTFNGMSLFEKAEGRDWWVGLGKKEEQGKVGEEEEEEEEEGSGSRQEGRQRKGEFEEVR